MSHTLTHIYALWLFVVALSTINKLKNPPLAMRLRLPPLHVALLALALALAAPSLASSGNRHDRFRACHASCASTCAPGDIGVLHSLLGWDCASECDYKCAHSLTDASDRGEEYYHQFHGKWAFSRAGGMQEPASVLFSLGNLAVHAAGYKAAARRIPRENGMRAWLLTAAGVHINTWLWSAVFHTRDLPWTERLDYFSATVTIGMSLLYAIVRVFGLQTPRSRSALLWPVSAAVLVTVLAHFAYVSSLPHFPYGYHVAFAAALGMVGNLLWIMWSASFIARPAIAGWRWPAPYPRINYGERDWTPALLTLATIAAMSLELLDFPPIFRVLDAHACWHAATIPIGAAWWRFLIRDANRLDTRVLSGPPRMKTP